MPFRLLNPYIAALPVVRAGQAIRMQESVGMGTGSFTPGTRDEIARRWRGAVARPAERPKGDELAGLAKGAGIGFRKVTVPKA